MLEVQARDGAGRIAQVQIGERRLVTPALFWHVDHVPARGEAWEPLLAPRPDSAATLVASPRFTEAAAGTSDQWLLRRRLAPTASMLEGGVRLEPMGAIAVAWADAFDAAKDPKRLAAGLAASRDQAGFSKLLYAPGLGAPSDLALLAYAGIDLFDATPLLLAAARGRYLTAQGSFGAASLAESECLCPACTRASPSALAEEALAAHNQYAARTELALVRNAIRGGRLRELVEARCRAHPERVAALRRLDAQYDLVEARTPVQRATPVWATTKESLQRAECVRFRRRVAERYRPPTSPPVLLLLPCSARKPYSTSRTHRSFADALWAAGAMGLVHEVILTSPLGLVPRELELTYPAAHYDVPVTGEWDEEEGTMIRGLLAGLLAKRSYARVVSHLPQHTYDLVRALLPAGAIVTCEGENATAPEALRRLELTLRQLTTEHKRAALPRLQRERLKALADYQFGPEASDALFAGADVVGKWPTGKVVVGGGQLAMLPTSRGLLSLTLAGARRLLDAHAYTVEIDDFRPKGGIFAVGVKAADPRIRPGDEVVVHHGGDLRAVGTALMSGREMVDLKRGEAVNARHVVPAAVPTAEVRTP